jgi:hypothetical protein
MWHQAYKTPTGRLPYFPPKNAARTRDRSATTLWKQKSHTSKPTQKKEKKKEKEGDG